MNPFFQSIARRSFLKRSGLGLGALALQHLGAAALPHRPGRVKRVIHLCMAGGPSQFESFDWKPELKRLDGKPFPESFTKGQQLAQLQNTVLKARGPFTEFKK